MTLPPELWCIIADRLRGDQSSLASLCQVHTQIYLALLPTLYEKIHLCTSSSIFLFSSTVVTNSRKLAPLVTALQVGEYPGPETYNQSRLHKNSAKPLRAVLELLFNLRDLSLATTATAFNVCFADLTFPFQLRRLVIPSIESIPFHLFLSKQPLVTELRLLPAGGLHEEGVRFFIASNPHVLRHCKSAAASLFLLNAIVPGRQLSEITVMWDNLWSGRQYTSGAFSFLQDSTITSVGWHSLYPDLYPWTDNVDKLKLHNLHEKIERLKFIEPFEVFTCRIIVVLRSSDQYLDSHQQGGCNTI
jgi:hypothetical protein